MGTRIDERSGKIKAKGVITDVAGSDPAFRSVLAACRTCIGYPPRWFRGWKSVTGTRHKE
jgi:hypothetical protein